MLRVHGHGFLRADGKKWRVERTNILLKKMAETWFQLRFSLSLVKRHLHTVLASVGMTYTVGKGGVLAVKSIRVIPIFGDFSP